MSDSDDASSANGFVIPPQLKQKFPELIALIAGSQSMNDGERQYWADILPVMTSEQLEQLKKILTNERDQLAAIDKKYNEQIEEITEQRPVEEIGEMRQAKAQERSNKENSVREAEEKEAEELLRKMDDA